MGLNDCLACADWGVGIIYFILGVIVTECVRALIQHW